MLKLQLLSESNYSFEWYNLDYRSFTVNHSRFILQGSEDMPDHIMLLFNLLLWLHGEHQFSLFSPFQILEVLFLGKKGASGIQSWEQLGKDMCEKIN